MPHELTEFVEIVEGEWSEGGLAGRRPNREELTRSLQVLMTRQCIYRSTPSIGRTFEIVHAYAPFFEMYFGAMGYRLVVSNRDQMIALSAPQGETRYDSVYERLRKDETVVLLTLRLMWEEAVGSQDIQEGGIAETTTGDLVDRMKSATQTEPPDENRLADILRKFQRHGVVRVGERDRVERVSPLSILPGVSILVPDAFVENLKLLTIATPDGKIDDLPDFVFEGPATDG